MICVFIYDGSTRRLIESGFMENPAVLTLMVFKLLLYISSPKFPSDFAVLFLTIIKCFKLFIM